ncbi:MAG TPA: hypothetical protein VF346_04455, partial [Bacteroidales bacterium]
MKPEAKYAIFLFMAVVIFLTLISNIAGTVVVYPPPPGLKTSPDFTLKANDIPVWVERIGSKMKTFSYSLYSGREMEDLNVANFSCSGTVTLRITASTKINSFMIRPKSLNITAAVNGNELIFSIAGPQKLYIEINGSPHLALFANPLEVKPPKKGDRDVIYFGPGIYT